MEIRKDENGRILNIVRPPDVVRAEETLDAMVLEQSRMAAVLAIPLDDDATALAVAPACPEWQPGTHYDAGEIVNRDGQAYRVVQAVDSLENQPPDAVGMLAIYRPIDPAPGTIDEPKKFIYGMDVQNGLYYTYKGKLYLAKADMPNCTYYPGQEGVWQWELIN